MLLLECRLHPCSCNEAFALFDLLKPSPEATVLDKKATQKSVHDSHAQEQNWFVRQSSMAKNLCPGPQWIPAVIVEQLRHLSFLVETTDHHSWRRHRDQLKETDYLAPDGYSEELSPPIVASACSRQPFSRTFYVSSIGSLSWRFPGRPTATS